MFDVLTEYVYLIASLFFVAWSTSAMIYVWYRVWYVERMWQAPNEEKSEKAIAVSGEIFDISRALMVGASAGFVLYGLLFVIGSIGSGS